MTGCMGLEVSGDLHSVLEGSHCLFRESLQLVFGWVPAVCFQGTRSIYLGDYDKGLRFNEVLGRVFRERYIEFQVRLRRVFEITCGSLPSSSRLGSLESTLGTGRRQQDPDVVVLKLSIRENMCGRR